MSSRCSGAEKSEFCSPALPSGSSIPHISTRQPSSIPHISIRQPSSIPHISTGPGSSIPNVSTTRQGGSIAYAGTGHRVGSSGGGTCVAESSICGSSVLLAAEPVDCSPSTFVLRVATYRSSVPDFA
eukprot:2929541-Rhodomonas_salina.7